MLILIGSPVGLPVCLYIPCGVKCTKGAVLFPQEFSTLCLQLKDCSASRKAEEHCETHLVHLTAPEGCSWRTGEFCNILPDWKSGTLSDPCRVSMAGFLGRKFCNVFMFDCCLNSLQQLVFSQLFCLAVFVIPLPVDFPGFAQSTSLAWGSC